MSFLMSICTADGDKSAMAFLPHAYRGFGGQAFAKLLILPFPPHQLANYSGIKPQSLSGLRAGILKKKS